MNELNHFAVLTAGEAANQSSIDLPNYSARIVYSSEEIAELAPFVRSVAPDRPILDPRFFLASILPEWRPRVVIVTDGPRVAGILYCRERVLAGMHTHIVVGDDSLNMMVVALPAELNSVIYCAANALIGAKAALRLMVDPSKLPLLGGLQGLSGIRLNRAERHAHLALTPTFDEFLAKLGPHTRRNFRSFRRKSEQAGNEFIADLPYAEFCAAARALVPNSNYSDNTTNFERCLEMIGAMPSRITAGLRDRNGKMISVAGGFHDGRRGIMVMQLNDRTLPRASLSLVLRSYLIENLIDLGFEEFVFWAGSSAPLSEYCVSPELWIAHIDSRAIRWRVARVVGAIVGRLAPRASRRWIKWVVPDTDSEHEGAKLE